MIQYNELQITSDGKYLIIDASIETSDYFKDMFIDSIIIDNQDTYVDGSPSDNPIYTYNLSETTAGNETITTFGLSMIKNGESYYYVDENKRRIRLRV